MPTQQTMVIIGTGVAGVRAAVTLRKQDAECRIILISEDAHTPYDKVPLSKHYLYGQPGFHSLYFYEPDFYASQNIELWLDTPVAAIDRQHKEVVLKTGQRQHYDKLLLATGLAANRWAGQGNELKGVHYLRTLDDAKQLRDALYALAKNNGTVAVIGTGWIGCEVAAAAYEYGVDVGLIGRESVPLFKQAGTEIGEFYRQAHTSRGVQLYMNAEVAALHGAHHVSAVELADGRKIPADLVVFGIGATPRTDLAATAGLEIASAEAGGGIVTNAYLQTSDANIFAAGDVAHVPTTVLDSQPRREHHMTAWKQGQAAALAMLGQGQPYAREPFFFSDQFDIWMETTGDWAGADDFVMRHYSGKEQFIAFWLRDGQLAAGMNVNIKGVPRIISALIKAGKIIDKNKLADPKQPLEDLL